MKQMYHNKQLLGSTTFKTNHHGKENEFTWFAVGMQKSQLYLRIVILLVKLHVKERLQSFILVGYKYLFSRNSINKICIFDIHQQSQSQRWRVLTTFTTKTDFQYVRVLTTFVVRTARDRFLFEVSIIDKKIFDNAVTIYFANRQKHAK